MIPKQSRVTEPIVCVPDKGYIEDGPMPHKLFRTKLDTLLLSTGHRFFNGEWKGNHDRFHVVKHDRKPAVGIARPTPEFSGTNTFWRNSVARAYEGNPYIFKPPYSMLENFPPDLDFSNWVLYLNDWGTKGIKSARPGNPQASVFQFMAELRELPRLPGDLFRELPRFRGLGNEYLNIEFGWKPFIQDVQKAYNTFMKCDKLLDDLIRENGNYLKRRRQVERSSEYEVVAEGTLSVPWGDLSDLSIGGALYLSAPLYVSGYFGPNMYNDYPVASGTCDYKITRESFTNVWYKGRFRYYVPDIGSSQWTQRATSLLFGVTPTPDAIYSVLPWSWFIDWFTNLGTIISNFSQNAVDNETLDNSFVMASLTEGLRVEVSINWDGWQSNYPPGTENLTYYESSVVKLREVATPYGFGIPYDSLSLRQKGILAALAISRQRFLP